MKGLKTLLLIIAMLAVSGVAVNAETTQYKVRVGNFSKLKVYDNMKVEYRCNEDSAGYAVFRCDDSLADAFIFSNNGGTLSAHVATEYTTSDALPVVTLYSTFLINVESASSHFTRVFSPMGCADFKCMLIGNGQLSVTGLKASSVKASLETGKGTLSISGICDKAMLKMVGTGIIQADGLECNDAICTVLGTGSIGCRPTDLLKLKGLGSTTVYYRGTPKKIVRAGVGKLVQLKDL